MREFINKLTPPTVERFRQAGFKVSVTHVRPVLKSQIAELIPHLPPKMVKKILKDNERPLGAIRVDCVQGMIWPRGGRTTVKVEKEGMGQFIAHSACSIDDGYNRTTGIKICLGKLIHDVVNELRARGN